MTARRLARATIVAAGCLWAVAGAALPELDPVEAHYRITVNGIPAGTATTVAIEALGGNRHRARFEAQNRFFRHSEVSQFDWNGCSLVPREYHHDFSGLGIERHSFVEFDWNRKVAIESRGEKRQEIPLVSNAIDALGMAQIARCELRAGYKVFDFPVIYRGERRDIHFEVAGHERVETPVGTFDTVIVERRYPQRFKRTRVWVAPALDWFMVRFEHVENPAARGSLLLTEYIVGKPPPASR